MIMYMSDILCVTNRTLCREDFLTRLERIAACHPAGIILREKDLSPDEYQALAAQVMALCERYDVPCILHSFVDTALELRSAAIHLPLHILREMTPEQKSQFHTIGASCHSVEDAMEAQRLGCTYITAGHVFETACKAGLQGRGLDFLKTVCESVSIPVYAIGGISAGNLRSVRGAGAKGACVMSGLMGCEDPETYLASFPTVKEETSMLSEILERNRSTSPLVHCISNYVTANDCVNLLLASGASAIMADDADEVEEITAMCQALVLNLGTPNPRRLEAMRKAGKEANRLGHPVVFDPVGVGGSTLRREAARQLLETVRFSVIRGNASEIRTLVDGSAAHRGVDTDAGCKDTTALARQLARSSGAVVVLTGETDIVTDGQRTYLVKNGHPMMRTVTGAGCQLSALIGACAAANPEKPLLAALAAVCAMGLCGELAHRRITQLDGNASYRNYIIDAMFRLDGTALEEGANYEIL